MNFLNGSSSRVTFIAVIFLCYEVCILSATDTENKYDKLNSGTTYLNFTGFTRIENPPQEFRYIDISIDNKASAIWKNKENTFKIASPMWTIEPHDTDDGVIVSTIPAGLVKPTVQDDALVFDFNEIAFQLPEEAGVRIQLPSKTLEKVSVGDKQTVQVLYGFTNLTSLSASSFSRLIVSLDGTAATQNNKNHSVIAKASINSEIVLETNASVVIDASVISKIRVKGSIMSGKVETASVLYLEGDIIDKVDVSGRSIVYVNDDSGCDKVNLNINLIDKCSKSSIKVTVSTLNATIGVSSSATVMTSFLFSTIMVGVSVVLLVI